LGARLQSPPGDFPLMKMQLAKSALANILLPLALSAAVSIAVGACGQTTTAGDSAASRSAEALQPLRFGISPYQEIALIVNEKPLALEKKYGVKLDLVTLPWEDLLPAVASAGQTIDVGLASLSDYVARSERLNTQHDDPIIYLYPAWVFHGGGFITFNKDVPEINERTIKDPVVVKKFLDFKVGAQNNSLYHMMLWKLCKQSGVNLSDLKITDTTLNDGILATENGSLDIASAGLTQRTEALKRGGRVVLTMDTIGLMDPGGFVCKESVYKKRKKEIDALIHIWYDCTHYVMSDLDHHSGATLAYLKANASTKYTLAEFKSALAQEYIPQSVEEAQQEIVSGKGRYSLKAAGDETNQYLLETGVIKSVRKIPRTINP
jgi:ABC-type nitrate/sulfonate/bicarbonate transport system substrate-binding protein